MLLLSGLSVESCTLPCILILAEVYESFDFWVFLELAVLEYNHFFDLGEARESCSDIASSSIRVYSPRSSLDGLKIVESPFR